MHAVWSMRRRWEEVDRAQEPEGGPPEGGSDAAADGG